MGSNNSIWGPGGLIGVPMSTSITRPKVNGEQIPSIFKRNKEHFNKCINYPSDEYVIDY